MWQFGWKYDPFRNVCPQLYNTVYNINISHHNLNAPSFWKPVSAGDIILIHFTLPEKPIEGNWAIYVSYWGSWVCVQISWLALTQFTSAFQRRVLSVCALLWAPQRENWCVIQMWTNVPLKMDPYIYQSVNDAIGFHMKSKDNGFLCLLLKAEHRNWNIILDFEMLRKRK